MTRSRYALVLLRCVAAAALAAGFGGEAGAAAPVLFDRESLAGDYLAGRAATAERDTRAAALYLGRALQADPGNLALVERTFLLRISDGDIDGALPLATQLVQQRSAQSLAKLALAIQAIHAKAYGAAKPLLTPTDSQSQGQNQVSNLTAGLLAAWAEAGQGNTDAALKIVDGLTGPEWYEVFKNYTRSLVADLGGRSDDALKWMKAADAADGTGVRMAEGYARLLARSGDSAGALKVLTDFTAQARQHPVIDALMAEINAGKTPAPLITTAEAGAAEALYGIGIALNTNGGEDLSTIYLQFALYLDPQLEIAHLAVGELFQAARNYDSAIDAYKAVPDASPLKQTAVIDTALALDAVSRTDEAAAELSALLAKEAGDTEAAQALGDIYRGHKRFEESIKAYSAAIGALKAPSRQDWRLYYSRGISYERTNSWPEAEADFQTALKLFPNQPQVLNYLGYSWIDKGMHLDEAVDMIKSAVDLRPDDGYIVDSLGWAYYRLGRYEDAVTQLERAISLRPEDPTLNDHLGDAYYRVGRKLEARFQWNHARDLGPDPADLPAILKKIDTGAPADAVKG